MIAMRALEVQLWYFVYRIEICVVKAEGYSLYVQKEKEQDHSHAEELEHYHVKLQEYPHPSDIFGIHRGVYQDIDWTLEILFPFFWFCCPYVEQNRK